MQAVENELQASKLAMLEADLVLEKVDRRRREQAERSELARALRDLPPRGRSGIGRSQR